MYQQINRKTNRKLRDLAGSKVRVNSLGRPPKYRDTKGNCIAILFESIAVMGLSRNITNPPEQNFWEHFLWKLLNIGLPGLASQPQLDFPERGK